MTLLREWHNERTNLVPSTAALDPGIPAFCSAVPNYRATPSSSDANRQNVQGSSSGRISVSDDYIVSLIRRTPTLHHETSDTGMGSESDHGGKSTTVTRKSALSPQGTTWGQTVVNLVKGYVGCGILSLPWAISQLGIPLGLLGILFMSVWTSYNCWTVTKLKQYIERTALLQDADEEEDGVDEDAQGCPDDESRTETSVGTSVSNTTTATTYPDVGAWAYGSKFHTYVSVCICAQQLAICTVFVGFVGENLEAALRFWHWEALADKWGRSGVTALVLPAVLGLSCGMPTVKSMVPLMVLGTLLMLSGFALLGWIGVSKWKDRPAWDTRPTFQLDGNAFMALCGILYSYEGICIILPVESSMRRPVQEFPSAFGVSIAIITILLCGMAGLSVLVFGEVTNGSITAFLLETYGGDESGNSSIAQKTVLSNLLVSLSIVLSYPLMLYPAVELVAPVVFDWTEQRRTARKLAGSNPREILEEDDDEDSLGFAAANGDENSEGFEPMAGIPEHGVPSMRSLPSLQNCDENANGDGPYADDPNESNTNSNSLGNEAKANRSLSRQNTIESNASSTGVETFKTGEAMDGGGVSESATLISRLSSNMSFQQSIVESVNSDNNEESIDENGVPSPKTRKAHRHHHKGDSAFEWVLPGDSPVLRAGLVLGTFLVAVLVPNVQSLVSLVGAVTGSSTALLIPPILELAYIRHMEAKDAAGRIGSSILGDWEGGPTIASKRMLLGHSPKLYLRSSSSGRQTKRKQNKYLCDKIVSWFLLILGSVFALIGSYFSIRDILQSYNM